MGVAELRQQGTLDTLIRDADAALYRAKHAGRNAVSV
jgi:PleD family two-component response regulator